jgi:hypothetical protein
MSITSIYNFDDSDEYIFDPALIDISSGKARLKKINNPGQIFNQPFTSSTSFTYDSAKTEFSAGLMQQKDTRPANATCAATFTTNQNFNWGNGTLTGTLLGNSVISGGKLDCNISGNNGCWWNDTGNNGIAQTGTVRFKYTPNFSGANPTLNNLIALGQSTGTPYNRILLLHRVGGTLRLYLNDNTGATIHDNVTLLTWLPTAGQEYEFELNIDCTTPAYRLFIDGVKVGELLTGACTHTASTGRKIVLGNDETFTYTQTGKFDSFEIFSTVQHTANYTPGYSINETIYLEDIITLPTFTYSGCGNLQTFTAFATTQTGSQKFNINGKYWNGTAWVTSDDSLAQMSTVALINTNISTLTANDSVNLKTRWSTSSNAQESINDLNLTYTGQIYSVANPAVKPTSAINAEAMISINSTLTATGSDLIKFSIEINSTNKYFNGSSWVNSSGYAQSNLLADITTNIASLNCATGSRIKFIAYLHSDSGITTPNIEDITEVYNFWGGVVTAPNICIVWGYIYDNQGNPLNGVSVKANLELSTIYNSQIQLSQKKQETTTNSIGYWELNLTETESIDPNIKYKFEFKGFDYEEVAYRSVPNLTSIAYVNLV